MMLEQVFFKEFLEINELNCLTMYDDSNIEYTFCNSRSQKSLIDHLCISNNINNNINSLNILDDGDNLSDHCPLLLNVEFKLDKYYVSNPYRESPRKIQILCSEDSINDKKEYKQILRDLLVNLDVDKDVLHCPLLIVKTTVIFLTCRN